MAQKMGQARGQHPAAVQSGPTTEKGLARAGIALANWSERWFPDPLVFALLGVVIVFLIGLAAGENASTLAIQAGKNFWTLVPFTMQMVMVLIGGYVVASAPIMRRAIIRIALVPHSGRAAIAVVALFSMLSVAAFVGHEPDLQRLAGSRTGTSSKRHGLSRRGLGRIPRDRSRVGAGTFLLRRDVDGDESFHAGRHI